MARRAARGGGAELIERARSRRWANRQTTAKYIGCSIRTLSDWEAAGIVKGYRAANRIVRYDLNEIDDAFESGGAA
ncbi:DNA-binding protein [Williamsia sp. SKLECPSW1]